MPTCNKIVNLITSSKCKQAQQRYIGFVSPSMDFVIYPTIRPQYAAMRFGTESTLNLKTLRRRLSEGGARVSWIANHQHQPAFHFTRRQSSPAQRV
jgi:hypothetical protein